MLSILLIYFTFVIRAKEALRQCLPEQLRDNTFAMYLKEDNSTKRWLSTLLKNLNLPDPGLSEPRNLVLS